MKISTMVISLLCSTGPAPLLATGKKDISNLSGKIVRALEIHSPDQNELIQAEELLRQALDIITGSQVHTLKGNAAVRDIYSRSLPGAQLSGRTVEASLERFHSLDDGISQEVTEYVFRQYFDGFNATKAMIKTTALLKNFTVSPDVSCLSWVRLKLKNLKQSYTLLAKIPHHSQGFLNSIYETYSRQHPAKQAMLLTLEKASEISVPQSEEVLGFIRSTFLKLHTGQDAMDMALSELAQFTDTVAPDRLKKEYSRFFAGFNQEEAIHKALESLRSRQQKV